MMPEGWLSPAEAGALETLARGRVVCEVGAWLGLSTVTLAKVAKLVFSVDHHKGSPEHQPGGACFDPTLVNALGQVDTLPRFRQNLQRNGVADNVVVVVGDFETVAPRLGLEAFDLVFIDACHSTEAVKRHGELALELVEFSGLGGGVVAFHDANWPSVAAGIDALALGRPFLSVGSLVAFRYE